MPWFFFLHVRVTWISQLSYRTSNCFAVVLCVAFLSTGDNSRSGRGAGDAG